MMQRSLLVALLLLVVVVSPRCGCSAEQQDPIPGCNGWISENVVYLSANQTIANCLAPRLSLESVIYPLQVIFRNVTFDSSVLTVNASWSAGALALLQVDIVNCTSYFQPNQIGASLVNIGAVELLPGSYIRIADSNITIQQFGFLIGISSTSALWGTLVEVSNNVIVAFPSVVAVVAINGGSQLGNGSSVEVFNNTMSFQDGQSYSNSDISFTIVSVVDSTKPVNMTNGFRASIYGNVVSLGNNKPCQRCTAVYNNVYETTTTILFFKSSTTSFAVSGGGVAEVSIFKNTATWDSVYTTKGLSMVLFLAMSTVTSRVAIEANTLSLLSNAVIGQVQTHKIFVMSIGNNGIANAVSIKHNLVLVRNGFSHVDASGTISLLFAVASTFASEVVVEGNRVDLVEALTYYKESALKLVSFIWVEQELICATGSTLNVTNNVLDANVDYWSVTASVTNPTIVYAVIGALVTSLTLQTGAVYMGVGNTILANQSYLGTKRFSGSTGYDIHPQVAAPTVYVIAFRINDLFVFAPSSKIILEGNTLLVTQPTTGMNDAVISFIYISLSRDLQLQSSSRFTITSNTVTVVGVPVSTFMSISRAAEQGTTILSVYPTSQLNVSNNTMSINISTPLKNASVTPSAFSFVKLVRVSVAQIQRVGIPVTTTYFHITSNNLGVVMLYPTAISVYILHLSQLNVTIHTDGFFLLDTNTLILSSTSSLGIPDANQEINPNYMEYLANVSGSGGFSSNLGNLAILKADDGVVFNMASSGSAITVSRCTVSVPYYVDLALSSLHIHILDIQPSMRTINNASTNTSGGVILGRYAVRLEGNTVDVHLVTADGPCAFMRRSGVRLSGPAYIAISLVTLVPLNTNLDGGGGQLSVHNNNVLVKTSTGSTDSSAEVSTSSSCASLGTSATMSLLSIGVEVISGGESAHLNVTGNNLSTSIYETSPSMPPRAITSLLLNAVWNSTHTNASWFGSSMSQPGINIVGNRFTTSAFTTAPPGIISIAIFMAIPPHTAPLATSAPYTNHPYVQLHDNTLHSPTVISSSYPPTSFIVVNITTTNADTLAPLLLLTTGSFIDLRGNRLVVVQPASTQVYVPGAVGVFIGVDSPTAIIDSVMMSRGNVFTMEYRSDDPPSDFLHYDPNNNTIRSKFIIFKLESTTELSAASSSSLVVNSWEVCGGNYIAFSNALSGAHGSRSIQTLADGTFTSSSNINVSMCNCYAATITSTPTPRRQTTPTLQQSPTHSFPPPTTTTTSAPTQPPTSNITTTTTPTSTSPPLSSCIALLGSPLTDSSTCTSQPLVSMHALWATSNGLASIIPNITSHPPNLANPSNVGAYRAGVTDAKTVRDTCNALAGGVVEAVPWEHWGNSMEPVWVGLAGPHSSLLGYYGSSQSTYLSIPNATSLATLNTAIEFTAQRVTDGSSNDLSSVTTTSTSSFHVQLERMSESLDTTTTPSSSNHLKLSILYVGPANPVAGYKVRILLPASRLLRCEDGTPTTTATRIFLEVLLSPKPQLTDTAAIGEGIGAVGAVGGGVTGSSGSVVKAGLLTSLASLLRCEAPDLAAPVPLLQNTLGIRFGPSEEGQYYRGGIISGIAVFMIVSAVLALALIPAKMLAIMGEYTATQSVLTSSPCGSNQHQGQQKLSSTITAVINASFNSSFGGLGISRNNTNTSFSLTSSVSQQQPQPQPPPPPTWQEAVKFAHFPGVLILVVALCGEAIVPSASTLISMPGATGGDITFGLFGLTLYVVYIGHVLFTVGVNPPVVVRTKATVSTQKRGSKLSAPIVKLFSSPVVLVPNGPVESDCVEDGEAVEDKYANPTPETVSSLNSLSGIRSLLSSPETSSPAAWLLLYTPYSDELQMISFKAIELAGGTVVNLLDGIVTDRCFIKGIGLLLVALALFTIIVIKRPYAVPSQQVMSMALYGSLLLATIVVVVNLFKHHSVLDSTAEVLFIITAFLTVVQAAVDVMVSLVTVNVFVTSILGWRRAAAAASAKEEMDSERVDTPPSPQKSPTSNSVNHSAAASATAASPPLLVLEGDKDYADVDDDLYIGDGSVGSSAGAREVGDGIPEEEAPPTEKEIQRRILEEIENWAHDKEMEESLI